MFSLVKILFLGFIFIGMVVTLFNENAGQKMFSIAMLVFAIISLIGFFAT